MLCRVDTDRVAGVDTGTLHMLHDAGDEEVLAIADGIDLTLGTHDILIQQDRMIHVHMLGDNAHVLDDTVSYTHLDVYKRQARNRLRPV